MSVLIRRSRGVLIALVALSISAGLAFAVDTRPMPEASQQGIASATEASGQTVPVGHAGVAEQPAVEESTEDPVTTDSTNHGALVSKAAQMATPDGFKNHGEFVSCVAHMPHDTTSAGSGAASESIDLTTLTPEDCQAAREDAQAANEAARNARAETRAAAKAERKAATAERRSGAYGKNR